MKRKMLVVALASLCLPDPSSAQISQNSVGRAGDFLSVSSRVGRSRRSPIRSLLMKRVDSVSWDETPFPEVIDWLRGQSSEIGTVNIIVRKQALERDRIDYEEAPISLEMKNATIAEILNEVLDQVSDTEPLTYMGTGNSLKISTKADFDRKLYIRVYDISDILFKVKNFFGSPQIDLQQQQQNQGGGGGSQGGQPQIQQMFSNTGGGGGQNDDREEDEDDDERNDEIKDWIRAIVEPDSWDAAGGPGTVEIFNKQLIVRNTLTVHEILGGPMHLNE